MIGYKKVVQPGGRSKWGRVSPEKVFIVELRIADDAQVSWVSSEDGIRRTTLAKDVDRKRAAGNKMRAEKAEVVRIRFNGRRRKRRVPASRRVGLSNWDPGFAYSEGETVTPRLKFDTTKMTGCASGIHFFITREEAEAYHL